MKDEQKLRLLKEKLAKYRGVLAEKMKNFRGVRHENALSELRYTQVMVYKDLIRSLEVEIRRIKADLT